LIFNFLFFQFLKAKIYLFFFRALNSQHGSKLSSLGPFEAFFKWKGFMQRSSCGGVSPALKNFFNVHVFL
jgi:hypothetical protein